MNILINAALHTFRNNTEFNNFFAMQTYLNDSEAVLPELSLPENQLCDIEISETDVEDVLSILNPSKASYAKPD
jgi:hypothetical protein